MSLAHQDLLSGDFPGKNTGSSCIFLLWVCSWPRDRTHVSYLADGFFTAKTPSKPTLWVNMVKWYCSKNLPKSMKDKSTFTFQFENLNKCQQIMYRKRSNLSFWDNSHKLGRVNLLSFTWKEWRQEQTYWQDSYFANTVPMSFRMVQLCCVKKIPQIAVAPLVFEVIPTDKFELDEGYRFRNTEFGIREILDNIWLILSCYR